MEGTFCCARAWLVCQGTCVNPCVFPGSGVMRRCDAVVPPLNGAQFVLNCPLWWCCFALPFSPLVLVRCLLPKGALTNGVEGNGN